MAVLKCKMCGGSLDVTEGMTVCECEYCGTTQTIPQVDDEKKITLFTRANRLRAACEFDKAASVYENIVSDFPEEAEAYWGLILCKFGIEYVDDPATGKKIPTCHRSSFESIMDDSDFEQCMENADSIARRVYREEAKTIDGIQKGILEISGKEEPYDIFICYKETDDSGNRTVDSVMAQDIYDMLTANKYRVFFARISLEDKLGTAYEPYIFAALNSARIMLAVGTDYEYYNAVWVKNEWSRFLAMMSRDKKKVLIPCYKGIDAYDIPKEFKHLQAQDMGKVGAMQDLLRGIKKILPKETAPVVQQVQQVTQVVQAVQPAAGGANVNSLLQRAFMFLEDGDWKSADQYCEKVLDADPQNGEAYLGKLMAELNVRKREDLCTQKEMFDGKDMYKKIMRYGSETLKQEVAGYNCAILCHKAADKMKSAKTVWQYEQVKQMLIDIRSFKDAEVLISKCDESISDIESHNEEIYQKASAMAANGDYLNSVITYSSILNYRDSFEQIKKCAESSLIKSQQQQEKIEMLKRQQEDIKKELTTLNNNLAFLKEKTLQFSSCRDSLRRSREDQRTLTQQREAFAAELSGMGVFAFSRKKQLQASINDCDAQLAVLSKNIAALDNGTDYDAVIQQNQTAITETLKSCTALQKKIDTLQNDIDAEQVSVQSSMDSFEFGVRMNSVLMLTKEALLTRKREVNEYIRSNNISNVIIPNGVMSIGDSSFRGCESLESVVIPYSVTSIGGYAFCECTNLISASIPESVTSIGEYAFCKCRSLISVVIPDSVTSIKNRAFDHCNSLTSITIPDGVTSIGNCAFVFCNNLSNITIPNSVTSVGGRAFFGWSSSQTIYIKGRRSIPSGWVPDWKYKCDAKIVWNA